MFKNINQFTFHLHIISFLGVFQVVRDTFNGHEDVYIDGGLLCNYPIHVFDGKTKYLLFTVRPSEEKQYWGGLH